MQEPPAWQTSTSGKGSVVHESVGSHALRFLVMENDAVKLGVPAALPAALPAGEVLPPGFGVLTGVPGPAVLTPGLGAPDGGVL